MGQPNIKKHFVLNESLWNAPEDKFEERLYRYFLSFQDNLRRKEVVLKHGHELLCDCGQPLDEQGVCTSCNPPEEQEEPVLEREGGDPHTLNFENEGGRVYEPEFDAGVDPEDTVLTNEYLEYLHELDNE